MRYLTRDQIDNTKWDQCVDKAYNTMVYGLSWYLDLMADNWSALVLGDYEAVMPLPFRRKYGFRYLYQPSFTQQFGIFSLEKIQRQLVIDFIDAIPHHYNYADIHLNKECLLYEGKEKLSLRNNFILDLNAPYESLRKNFSANSRMNIKRTERPEACSMRLGSVDDPEVVIELFAKNQVKYSDRFTLLDYDKLKALVDLGQKEKTIEIVGVYDAEDKICAASILLSYKNRKISIFSGSNQLARKEKAMFFLFDRFIQQHAGQNLVLDFAGSNDPGLANFYSGFASANEQYPGLKYNRLPWPFKLLKK
ncbi:MAG: hypothetical protein JWO58_2106 [Chitinophagaceae bacterium]|nr:hypothetical protein [Chitinophagaceae bacterium]